MFEPTEQYEMGERGGGSETVVVNPGKTNDDNYNDDDFNKD